MLDPTVFGPGLEDFKGQVDGFIDRVKASPKQDGVGEILYPGEKSQRLKTEPRADGRVAIPAPYHHLVTKLAGELGARRAALSLESVQPRL